MKYECGIKENAFRKCKELELWYDENRKQQNSLKGSKLAGKFLLNISKTGGKKKVYLITLLLRFFIPGFPAMSAAILVKGKFLLGTVSTWVNLLFIFVLTVK